MFDYIFKIVFLALHKSSMTMRSEIQVAMSTTFFLLVISLFNCSRGKWTNKNNVEWPNKKKDRKEMKDYLYFTLESEWRGENETFKHDSESNSRPSTSAFLWERIFKFRNVYHNYSQIAWYQYDPFFEIETNFLLWYWNSLCITFGFYQIKKTLQKQLISISLYIE